MYQAGNFREGGQATTGRRAQLIEFRTAIAAPRTAEERISKQQNIEAQATHNNDIHDDLWSI